MSIEAVGLVGMGEGELRTRWEGLCARVGRIESGDQAELTFEMVGALYGTPVRAYHNLGHVAACLTIFDEVRGLAEEADGVELALWLHDAVYFPERFDNEAQSAFVARTVMGLIGADAGLVDRVEGMIVATQHDAEPVAMDAKLVADIDVAVLGGGEEAYEAYRLAIWEEFSWAEEEMFVRGRLAFLDRQLEKSWIYCTAYFRSELESRARANLARERGELERML